ncbi:MAG: hypothetical protein LBQ48_06640 [Oscillospiraceae bacterium]|jgi:hypothetical protein|nr:hypothetical protein [Oscillospiraceae bacterium]
MNSLSPFKRQPNSKTAGILSRLLLVLFFTAALLACSLIQYSDGDDTFFLQTALARPGFFDFVAYLTGTMNGRISTTAALWLVFSGPIWLWRVLGAFFFALFAALACKLAMLIADAKTPRSIIYGHKPPINNPGVFNHKPSTLNCFPLPQLAVCAAFLLVNVSVAGYAGLWITGSVNYLWPAAVGLLAFWFPVRSLYGETENRVLPFACILPGVYVCLAQEQLAAVALVFIILITLRHIKKTPAAGSEAASGETCRGQEPLTLREKKGRPPLFLIAQCLCMLASFAVFAVLTLNASRSGKEIAQWLPEFAVMPFSRRVFISLQWLANGFAHHIKFLMAAIWTLLALRFLRGKKAVFAAICAVFTAVAVCSAFFPVLADTGLNDLDITKIVLHAPAPGDLDLFRWAAVVFWLVAAIATPWLLFSALKGEAGREAIVLLYLAGLAAAALMFFSPTIYASGERTFFVTGVLLTVVLAVLTAPYRRWKDLALACVGFVLLAALQLFENHAVIFAHIFS